MLAAVLVLGAAGPASAHATLVSSDPAEGAVLEAAPDRIGFTYNETVVGVPDGVQVFDADGDQVASSTTVSGKQLDVSLTDEVGEGTLVVVWRVLSEDGHPITGSLSFSVGAASASVTPPPSSPSAGATTAPWTLSLVRAVGYVGMFVAAGLVAFAVLFLPTGSASDRARCRLVTGARVGAVTTVVAWLAGLPLTAMYQLGGGAGSLTRSATWSTLPPTEYAVTGAVVAGVAVAVVLLGRGQPVRSRGRAAVVAGALAVSAPALTGHTRAATPEVLAVGADVLHLLAGSVWLGGLVGLALALPTLSGRDTTAGEVLARFSGVAAGILAALVVSGSLLTWRIVGSWSGLVETTYGRLLLVKIAIAVVAVLIAAWNRYALLPRLQQAARRRDRDTGTRLVGRSTAAEAAVLLVVLSVTGLLVDRSPEPEAPLAASAETARTGPQPAMLGDVKVLATVAPQSIGPNTVTIELLDSAGAPTEFFEPPRARLSSDDVDLGAVPVTAVDVGTYSAEVVLPSSGTWRLQVSLRTSEFDNPVADLAFMVEGG